ncbi:hypothetical protein D3C79_1114090 [compost metagenome]
MKGHACPCKLDHPKVVGTITHCNRILRRKAETISDFNELFNFRFASKDRV